MTSSLESNERELTFVASDGWELTGIVTSPAQPTGAGVVLVPGSLHERDAFVHGRSVPAELAAVGIASVRFDIRGRGLSRGERGYHDLAPLQQAAVSLDIAAAIAALTGATNTNPNRVGVLGEQDTATAAVEAVVANESIAGLALLSPRLGRHDQLALAQRSMPVFALVSREDRAALHSATGAYLAGSPGQSRLEVFAELGFGTTMFVARAYVQPSEPPIETMIAQWFSSCLMPDSG